MFSPQYREYIEETVALVRSFCIKSEQTIDLQNDYLKTIGYEPGLNPKNWKYYQNLNGEYHASDEPIVLRSSDSHQNIILSKATLLDNPLTEVDYGPGGVFHKELLNQYPKQRELILRIFNPVDIDVAIAANDFEILYFDTNYVHPRELSLLSKIQTWLYGYANRWHITSFGISDPLYPSACLGVMWLNITTAIINFRLEACLTSEVAEFHLWSFLGSRYRLDRFKDHLSNKQALYLYRNINYLRFHVGKEQTLLSLQKNITEPANISVSRFDITQSDATLIKDRAPLPLFLRTPYARSKADINSGSRRDVSDVYNKTVLSAINNRIDLDDDIIKCSRAIQSTVIDSIPTGLVELEVNTAPNEIIAPPKHIKLHHWFYLSTVNKTRVIFNVNLGDYGTISVTDKNAAVMFMFALHMLKGGSIEDSIGTVLVNRVTPLVYPSKAQLAKRVTDNLVDLGFVDALLECEVPIKTISSIAEFNSLCDDISINYYKQWLLSKTPFGSIDKSIVEDALNSIYRPYLCDFSTVANTYREWALEVSLPYISLTDYDYISLATNTLKEVTGIDITGIMISDRHKAMIAIMKLLTSYGILYVDGSIARSMLVYDHPFMDSVYTGSSVEEQRVINYGLNGDDCHSAIRDRLYSEARGFTLKSDKTFNYAKELNIGLNLKTPSTKRFIYRLEHGSSLISNVTFSVQEG